MRATTETEVVTALIDVSVSPERGVGFDDVATRIYNFPRSAPSISFRAPRICDASLLAGTCTRWLISSRRSWPR